MTTIPKENDMLLNMLANLQFNVTDFQSVGLTGDNTNLLSADEYKASEKITKHEFFQDEFGQFDESKFDKFYEAAGYFYNQLSTQDYNKTILDQAVFSQDNIWVEPDQRKVDYTPKLVRIQNENLVSSSLESVGKRGARTKSISEIAQSQQIYDTKTGEWKDSPNDSFFENFFDTLVLATYDEDVFDPETGQKIHSKGEYKLNDNGTYYYETLGGRDVYGKQVLNKMNILTTDGSFANRFDFFDSDDINQKSIGGTILKNAALVGTMFIPGGVGATIIGLNVAMQSVGLLATIGKLFVGNDNETLNNIQGWAKTVNRSTQSEYAAENTWCVENFLNMIGDTVGQLAEQRWIFKAAPALMGNTKAYKAMQKGGYDKLKADKLKQLNASKDKTVRELLDDIKTNSHPEKAGLEDYLVGTKILNEKKAIQYVDDIIKQGQEISAPLARAYMTALVVQDTYGEAKAAGASDLEAALLTLGYAWGEHLILKSDLGNWIMPELKGSQYKMKAIANALASDVKKANETYIQNKSKETFIQKILDIGKKIANGHYAQKALMGAKGVDTVLANALGESFEEVSEELLADFSKSVFNVTRWIRGEEALDLGEWENMGDRYLMSGLGGFFGGGITSAATDFSVSRSLSKMDRSQAMRELIHLVNEGKEGEFLSQLDKITLGNKNLSASEVITSNENGIVWAEAKKGDNQDLAIKTVLKNEVKFIKNILEAEGAKLSKESLLNKLTLEDQKTILQEFRFNRLRDTQSMGLFLQNYQTYQKDLISIYSELAKLDASKTDSSEESEEMVNRRKQLNEKLNETREKIKQYKEGKVVPEAIMDALFEMNPLISDYFTRTTLPFYAEHKSGKKWSELSDSEKQKLTEEYKEYAKTSMKNDIHTGAGLFRNMLELFTPYATQIQDYISNLQSEEYKGVLELQNSVSNIVTQLSNIDLDSPGFDYDSALGNIEQIFDQENLRSGSALGFNLFNDNIKTQLNTIRSKPITNDYKQKDKIQEYKDVLYSNLLEYIDFAVKPFIDLGHINPEVKRTLVKTLESLQDFTLNLTNNENIERLVEQIGYSNDAERIRLRQSIKNKYVQGAEILKQHIKDIKKLTHTPILQYLDQFRLGVSKTDLNLTEHYKYTKSILEDSNEDLSTMSLDQSWNEANDEALDLVNAFIAVVNGMKTDNASMNNPTGYTRILNNIFKKQGVKDYVELAEFDSQTADLILQDAEIIKNKLQFAKTLSAMNSGQKLKQQDRVGANKNYLLFKQVQKFITEIPDDWLGKDELKAVFDSLQYLNDYSSDNKIQLTRDERANIELEMTQIEDAIYEFFKANTNSEGGIDSIKLQTLLKNIAGNNGFFNKTDSLLTENTKSLDYNSFIWWIASRAALKSSNFLGAYKNSLTKEIAPISSQELATYLGVAAITNMNMLNSFVDAYRNTVVKEFNEKLSEDERKKLLNDFDNSGDLYAKDLLKYFGGHNVLPQYRNMVFIEGIPGSGKSKGVFTNVINVAKQIDPEFLKDALYIHATQKAADEANSATGLNGKALDRTEFLKWISSEWKDTKNNIKTEKTKDGKTEISGRFLYEDSYEINSEGQLVNKWKLNKYADVPKVIFIDEITHYNQQELSMIEQFARENGIVVLTAGDMDQDTQVVYSKIDGEIFDNTIHRNNFIRSQKLGVSLRTLNKQMTESVANMQATMQTVRDNQSSELAFTYFEGDDNHKGLYGVKTHQVDTDEISDEQLEEIKKSIQLMIDTAKEPIGYIYHDENSKLYKYLTSTYGTDKIIPYKDSDAQGLEGQYYIVENKRTTKGSSASPAEIRAYMRSLYTGISRSEQGALVIAPGSFGSNISNITSKKDDNFQLESITSEQKRKSYESRLEQIEDLLLNFDVEPIKIIPPAKVTYTSKINTPDSNILPPPIIPPTPTIPKGGYLTQDEAQQKLDQFLINLENIGEIKDLVVTNNTSGEKYTIEGFKVQFDDSTGDTIWYPMIELSQGMSFPLSGLSNYTISHETTNSIVPLYNIGDEIILDQHNVRITGIKNVNGDIEYDFHDIDLGNDYTLSQSEVQKLYKGLYVPNTPDTPSDTVVPDNTLENGTVEDYEAILTESNSEEEKFDGDKIIHEVYTFNMFEMGVSKDNNGMPKFNGPQNKFNARIDNAIGLMHLPKFNGYTYDQLEQIIGYFHNLVNSETDNSNIASRMKQLLGLSGETKIAFAIKSSAGRITGNNPIYDRYDIDDTQEELSYIKSDTLQDAKKPMYKKLVLIVSEDGKPVFELSTAALNSPLTIIQRFYRDDSGNQIPVFKEELDTFWKARAKYKGQKDELYLAIKDVINAHKNGNHPDLIDLFEFWLFTSNGIFYFDDNFNLASNETRGCELIHRKGDYQLDHNLQYTAKFEDIEDFAKDPRLNISSIFISKSGIVNDREVVKPGHSFVLVSDSNDFKTDSQLVDQYVRQQDPNYKGRNEVKLYYVIPPNGTVSDWITNQHNLWLNQAGGTNVIHDLGNDFTAYRILRSLLESGQFDTIKSSDSTEEEVKKVIKDLNQIESNWLEDSLSFKTPSQKFEYEQLVSSYGEKYARQHMIYQEQKLYLNSIQNWGKVTGPTSSNDKTISKRLSSYLTNMVWWRSPGHPPKITEQKGVLQKIQSVCETSSRPVKDIFYHPQYSKDEVGPFVKVQVNSTNKYSLGETPSKTKANFRINAKIDTRSFSIEEMSRYINEFNKYQSNNGTVYKLTDEGRIQFESRYLFGETKSPKKDFRTQIESDYKDYFDKNILDRTILNNSSITTKEELLLKLAEEYTKQKGNFGFEYNGKLYLTKLDDSNSFIINPTITFKTLDPIRFRIEDENGNYQDREVWFDIDNQGNIKQVNCRCTEFKTVDINSSEHTIEVNDNEFTTFKNAFDQVFGNARLGVPPLVKNSNTTQELIEKLIAEKNFNSNKLIDTLNRIQKRFEGKPEFNNANQILQKMLNYANSVATFNLNVDDIVTIGEQYKYKIQLINSNQIIGNIVNSEGNIDPNPHEFTEEEIQKMKKEEPECAPTTWKMI